MPNVKKKRMPQLMRLQTLSFLLLLVHPWAPLHGDSSISDTADDVVSVISGHSTLLQAPWPAVRVAVTDPEVANVQVLSPEQVLVQALKVGSTDLILWDQEEQQTWHRRISVNMDVQGIQKTLSGLFPSAVLEVSDSEGVLIVKGDVRQAEQIEQLRRYLDSTGYKYLDLTQQVGVQQVQLQVRVAEVSRENMRSMGVNWFLTDEDVFFAQRVGSSKGGALVPSIDMGVPEGAGATGGTPFIFPQDVTAGPLVSIIGGFPKGDMEFFLQALAENQYLRILANPTLVAMSGEEADFLAGGEFPIPVTQGGGNSNSITIEYREYGVRVAFRPVVLGKGSIRLHAMQEVSDITETGGITVQGFQVPGLITRRSEATLELKSGQSFAMAGLLQRTNGSISSRVPLLGDLPVLGPLFRSVRYREHETELVILVTASLVEPMDVSPPLPGVTHARPSDWELFIEGNIESKEPARLDPDSAEWMKEMGLDRLRGHGAWDSY